MCGSNVDKVIAVLWTGAGASMCNWCLKNNDDLCFEVFVVELQWFGGLFEAMLSAHPPMADMHGGCLICGTHVRICSGNECRSVTAVRESTGTSRT